MDCSLSRSNLLCIIGDLDVSATILSIEAFH